MPIFNIKHLDVFVNNMLEVNELTSIHTKLAGGTVGRKNDLQILNKSGVVLLTACWEAFIEDLLEESFRILITDCADHESVPISVRIKASKSLKEDKNEKTVWQLAGGGWRLILKAYGEEFIGNQLQYFHVPRPDNIDAIFDKLIGLTKISDQWAWKGMSNINAKKKLNDFIDLRGAIAHKIATDKNVWKMHVDQYRKLLLALAVITHNRTTEHLQKHTGKLPWKRARVGTIM